MGIGRAGSSTLSAYAERSYVRLPVALGQGQLHMRRRHNPGQPVLVLLHQTPSHSGMFEALMRSLDGDFDLIALDTPGFGQSDPLPEAFTIAGAARALHAAISAVHSGPFYLFGHHTGAALALQLAQDFPLRVGALALSGPCLLSEKLAQTLRNAQWMPDADAEGQFLQSLWQRMRQKDSSAPARITLRELAAAVMAGPTYDAAYAAVTQVDTAAQLAAVRCPLWLGSGDADVLYKSWEQACAMRPEARAKVFPGGSSYLCDLSPDLVATELRAFFFESAHG